MGKLPLASLDGMVLLRLAKFNLDGVLIKNSVPSEATVLPLNSLKVARRAGQGLPQDDNWGFSTK